MMTVREIRELLGVSRAEFSRRYNIPIRTLENWESGTREAPEWTMEILERVVRGDVHMDGIQFTQKTWEYVSTLRREYGMEVCSDPELDFESRIISFVLQPNDNIQATIYEIDLDNGLIRHKGIKEGCIWTEWEENHMYESIPELYFLYD